MEALQFRLDENLFAIDLTEVDEILMMASIRPLPDAPEFLAGVLNLRNEMVPVVDLSRRLGFRRPDPPPPVQAGEDARVPYRRNTRMLITTVDAVRIALIVDGTEEIRSYRQEDVRTSVFRDDAHPGFLDRLTVRENRVIQLVQIRNVLSDHELALLKSH
jgi:purine-binding chemotaxis protein CheW